MNLLMLEDWYFEPLYILQCVKICNDDPPIYVGANSSLDGTQFDAQFYHGKVNECVF